MWVSFSAQCVFCLAKPVAGFGSKSKDGAALNSFYAGGPLLPMELRVIYYIHLFRTFSFIFSCKSFFQSFYSLQFDTLQPPLVRQLSNSSLSHLVNTNLDLLTLGLLLEHRRTTAANYVEPAFHVLQSKANHDSDLGPHLL